MSDAVATPLCAVRDIRLQTIQTPHGSWLQHLLERFYAVAADLRYHATAVDYHHCPEAEMRLFQS